MKIKSTAVVTAAGMLVAVAFLAGCGPKHSGALTARTTPATPAAAPTTAATPTASPTPTVKDLTAGNCTMFTKDDAVSLIGAVNGTNKAIEIGTDGGTKIDVCSYLDLASLTTVKGVSYAVVRFDSDTTAFSEAQKVQTEMLSDANEHNWPVQSITATVPNAGQVLGGYGTKTEEGVTFTIAVVGTNVGPYLVVALGASTEGATNAENYALSVFTKLAAASS
ncbi:MAG TPA: hypothetical protein VH442_04420 [Micromonosporaceae bacterium]